MMHFRQRIKVIDEKQADKYFEKYTKWRKGAKRDQRFRKFSQTQEKNQRYQ